MNPVLNQPQAGNQAPSVAPLAAITAPMTNTQQDEYRYFYCALGTAAMHRQDGKKLPFMQHILKTNIKEDIAYLMKEIEEQNPYIRLANANEIQQAQIMEDPLGAVRAQVTKELSIEDLEKMLAERRKVAASAPITDEKRIQGVDVNTAARAALKAQDVARPGSVGTVGGANTATLNPLIVKK